MKMIKIPGKKNKIRDDTYHRIEQRFYPGGRDSFFVRPSYIRMFGVSLALFIQDLLQIRTQGDLWPIKLELDCKWFACTELDLWNGAGYWSNEDQTKYIKELCKMGVLKVRTNSSPPVRMLKLNLLRIELMIDKVETKRLRLIQERRRAKTK